jgi:hypothetical protein
MEKELFDQLLGGSGFLLPKLPNEGARKEVSTTAN